MRRLSRDGSCVDHDGRCLIVVVHRRNLKRLRKDARQDFRGTIRDRLRRERSRGSIGANQARAIRARLTWLKLHSALLEIRIRRGQRRIEALRALASRQVFNDRRGRLVARLIRSRLENWEQT